MKNMFRFLLISLVLMLTFESTYSMYEPVSSKKNGEIIKQTAAGCAAGSAFKYLDINNVRTILYSYGNGWFLENAAYEIPKGSGKTSMFSFSLWIGGIDLNNNLKLAAYKYGQGPSGGNPHTHNDFYPGPLKIDGTAAVDPTTCAKYDQLFQITRAEVEDFVAWWDNKADFPDYVIPPEILNYPAKGDRADGYSYYLAPFYDNNGDGVYNPKEDGDYPYYDFANALCPSMLKPGQRIQRAKIGNGGADDTLGILVDQVLKGDQTLWSVYNDKGNVHSETTGAPIGMEIRAQYFAFATNDEINNMTFYSYELINRSTYTLTETYFSQWVDPDLGYANDDYVGCDVGRGLGYCYNGTPIDGTGQYWAYGAHPPAVGVDFFQGPYLDPDGCDNPAFTGGGLVGPSFHGSCEIVGLNNTSIMMHYGTNNADSGNFIVRAEAINGVNFGDGIVDNERFGMRRFVYHNNQGVPSYMLDPTVAPQYYDLLRGIWVDGQRMTYGGLAHPPTSYGPPCDFMFPEMSDVCDWGTGGQTPSPKLWTESSGATPDPPGDRRFMQSAGPFTLRPGACNYITVGIPWARAAGTPWESVQLLKIVDDKCQKLFDNCFAVLNGPNAPDLTIQELDKQLIIYISNRKTNDLGNNYEEKYVEYDPNIPNPDNLPHNKRNDSLYRFEGYQIFQLHDATVGAADLYDDTKSRLVAQCDVQNGVSKLVNWTFDANLNGNSGQVMVNGADLGIKHTFVITQDQFSNSTNTTLVNHKQYYFMAVAYGYNQYKPYQPDSIDKGQLTPYLQGRGNIQRYTAIPHIPIGDKMNSSVGNGPIITRIQGQGNGGTIIDLSEQTVSEILSKTIADTITNTYGSPDYPIAYHPVYKSSAGPLNVVVIDPLNVTSGKFIVKFDSLVPGPSNSPFVNPLIQFGHWSLYDETTGITYPSDTTIIYPYQQMFLNLGLALTINQVPFAGDTGKTGAHYTGNNLLSAPDAIYADSTKIWLGGIEDNDIPADPQNWIRSGVYKGSDATLYDWDMGTYPWDPDENYAKIQNGTWAPYCMTVANDQVAGGMPNISPAYTVQSKRFSPLSRIASVDIVITPDKSKWTRAAVIEMCPDANLSEGNAPKFDLRRHSSVNIDGDTGIISSNPIYNSNYISSRGMGWFPGYAINLETGERLNIMFGENSWLSADNGRDMLWNPSTRYYNAGGQPVFGGMHYVYIMGSLHATVGSKVLDFPAYDGCAYFLTHVDKTPAAIWKSYAYASCMYVGMPRAIEGKQWLSNEVKIQIRISKPYSRYFSQPLPKSYSDTAENHCWPEYSFNTATIATSKQDPTTLSSDLALINVVPNPYYGYDDYEQNQLDNRIKIVNLPLHCTITIFNMTGTMIRQFVVDKSGIDEPRGSTADLNTDAKTSIDWDLKNFAGIPIAGGMYLIHVKADGIGERTLKWFGILRPVDLNSY